MTKLTKEQAQRLHSLSVEVKTLLSAIDDVGTSGYGSTESEPGAVSNKETLENQIGIVVAKLHVMYNASDLDPTIIAARVQKEISQVCGL